MLLFLAAASLWADTRCAGCHDAIVASYARTGKARSVAKPRGELQPERSWLHEFSGRRMNVVWEKGIMTHAIEDRREIEAHEAAWVVGSGREVRNFLIPMGDSLFLSPIAYYASRVIWDMSPGFQVDPNPNFYHPASAQCLACHTGSVAPRAGTRNRYLDPAIPSPAIGCAQCHGPAEAHLANPTRGSIINPAKLPPERRDSVCESCHLEGAARVYHPGRTAGNFVPGMATEEVFGTYVSRKSGEDTWLPVSTQSEQLAASLCAQKSGGALWCGTCHDSHRPLEDKQRAGWYRDRCVTCHQSPAFARHRAQAGENCIRCHMPTQGSFNGSHAARTDHSIRKVRNQVRFLDRGEQLRAWREPPEPVRARGLALAYLWSAEATRSLRRLREGVDALQIAVDLRQTDGEIAVAAARQFLRQKLPDRAIPWLEQAVAEQPGNSQRRLQFAVALQMAGRDDDARRECLEAIRLEPMLDGAYAVLAKIEPKRAEYWKNEYRKVAPKRRLP